jgi:4-hydroxy-2-oxoheptanedioate aldolase
VSQDATRFRARLDAGETLYAVWCMLAEPNLAEMLARQDWDVLVIDCQHGFIDHLDMARMMTAVHGTGTPALVRTVPGDEGLIGKALDLGAQGVIAPMINNAEDARWFASAANFPPVGERSWGPPRAMAIAGLDKASYLARANALSVSWAMVETAAALDNIDAICATDGIDGLFVGPNDLCVSLTGGAHVDPTHDAVKRALDTVLEAAARHNVYPGIFANTPELACEFAESGFRFISGGNDLGMAMASSTALLGQIRR